MAEGLLQWTTPMRSDPPPNAEYYRGKHGGYVAMPSALGTKRPAARCSMSPLNMTGSL
jgi:hypothetical protein